MHGTVLWAIYTFICQSFSVFPNWEGFMLIPRRHKVIIAKLVAT